MMNIDEDIIWGSTGLEVTVETDLFQLAVSQCRVRIRYHESAVLQLLNENDPFTLILDLQTSVVKQPSVSDETLSYSFGRLDIQGEFHFEFVTDETKKEKKDAKNEKKKEEEKKKIERIRIIQALEFVFSQYTLYSEFNILQRNLAPDAQHPNMVARGLEGVGIGFRLALRSGGRSTGSAIRYLGKKYTSATVKDNSDGHRAPTVANQKQIDAAEKSKSRAESCHAGARTLTSAALAPVRWIGKNASKIAPKNNGPDGAVRKVFIDTVGGLGNGVANICKVCSDVP